MPAHDKQLGDGCGGGGSCCYLLTHLLQCQPILESTHTDATQNDMLTHNKFGKLLQSKTTITR